MKHAFVWTALLTASCAHQPPPPVDNPSESAARREALYPHVSKDELVQRKARRHEESQASLAELRELLPPPVLRICERMDADCRSVTTGLDRDEDGTPSLFQWALLRIFGSGDRDGLERAIPTWFESPVVLETHEAGKLRLRVDRWTLAIEIGDRPVAVVEPWLELDVRVEQALPELKDRELWWDDLVELVPAMRRGVLASNLAELVQAKPIGQAWVSRHAMRIDVLAPDALRQELVDAALATRYRESDDGRLRATLAGGQPIWLTVGSKRDPDRVTVEAEYPK